MTPAVKLGQDEVTVTKRSFPLHSAVSVLQSGAKGARPLTYDLTTPLTMKNEHVHNEHLIAHMVATEAVLLANARDKGEVGDTEETDATRHGLKSAEAMRGVRGGLGI
jgi:predicted hydrolase (HD superfamily)